MLPQPNHDQACLPQNPTVSRVPPHVARDLALPFLGKLQAPLCEAPTMPEIAVNKHHYTQITNNEVRPSRQVAGVNLIVDAHAVQDGPYGEFRLCVPPSDPRHHRAALLGDMISPRCSRFAPDSGTGLNLGLGLRKRGFPTGRDV